MRQMMAIPVSKNAHPGEPFAKWSTYGLLNINLSRGEIMRAYRVLILPYFQKNRKWEVYGRNNNSGLSI